MIVRLEPEDIKDKQELDWSHEGIVAFSKICTHVGCPISLYEQQTHHVLCPCHQSTFDLSDGARVIFGPAGHALPQLRIGVNERGLPRGARRLRGARRSCLLGARMSTTTEHPTTSRERKAPAGERVADWADGRLGIYGLAKANMRKIFPDHWSFMLGEICLYSFIIIILTGVYLTLFFHPSMNEVVYHGSYVPLQGMRMSEAYASTLDISFDVRGGLLIRQIHHWAALIFLAGMFVHMMRVFFTGAFRKPREINWLFGFLLFVLGMFTGFTGYSLPDDLLSGTGVRFTRGRDPVDADRRHVPLDVPVRRGVPRHATSSPRFYSIHILLLPGIMLGLLVGHLILVFYHKHTQFAGPGKTEQERRRHAAAAGLHGQGRRLLLPGLRRHRGHRGDRHDQPDLGARPVPSGPGVHRRPARLVHGLLRGPDPRHAGLGDQPLGPHAGPGRVHPAGGLPAWCWSAIARLPVHRVLGHRRQARAPHPGPPAQRPDPHRVSASPGSRCTWCC